MGNHRKGDITWDSAYENFREIKESVMNLSSMKGPAGEVTETFIVRISMSSDTFCGKGKHFS